MISLLAMAPMSNDEPQPATNMLLLVPDQSVVMTTITKNHITAEILVARTVLCRVRGISVPNVCSSVLGLIKHDADMIPLGRRGRYDSDSESESRSPPPRQRRKSLGEQALAAVGLGGAAAALTGRSKDRDRSRSRARSRSRRRYDSRSPSRDRSEDGKKKFQQAAKAAITAGAIEAWRTRKEPGGFAGNGKRVLTAAIGAAGINGAMDRDPEKHKTRHTIEAALGGLAGNRLINGARESSRSRSRGRGPEKESNIGGIASAAGLAALAGKAFNDYRSKSRNRRNSFESDSRSQSPSRRKRSKSVTDYLRSGVDAGLAKLGLGDSENHHPKYGKDKFGRRHYDDDDDYNPRPRGGGGEEEHHGSDTDSYDSDEEISKQKKMRGKEFLTAGLATVATIHAAHSVHGSIQARKKNRREVMEGKMSPEEARKKKSKALLQEAAAIGIATLGIKGAVSEWKEVNEKRKECHEAKTRLAEKREHRRIKLSRQQSERSSEPNLGKRYQYDDDRGRYDDRGQYDDRGRYDDRGPRYYDDNPYSSGGLPPPPIGSARF